MSEQDKYLWGLLYLLLCGVFCLGFYDPSLRPAVLDISKVALGGLLGLITAKLNSVRTI